MKASNIRKGTVLLYNGNPYRVMDFYHHTPGNLRAMVQAKLRNLINGTQTDVRFSSTEEIAEADVMRLKASFLYSDQSGYHFMYTESYEQITMSAQDLGDAVYYLQDQMELEITTFEGNPIDIALPSTVVLTISETEPELRGATASNSPKPAKTETGLSINVPPFVKIGDKVIVGTAEGKYISRAE